MEVKLTLHQHHAQCRIVKMSAASIAGQNCHGCPGSFEEPRNETGTTAGTLRSVVPCAVSQNRRIASRETFCFGNWSLLRFEKLCSWGMFVALHFRRKWGLNRSSQTHSLMSISFISKNMRDKVADQHTGNNPTDNVLSAPGLRFGQ